MAKFIGESNIMDGVMKKDYLVSWDDQDYVCVDQGFKTNELVDIVIRPEDINIVASKQRYRWLMVKLSLVLFKGCSL